MNFPACAMNFPALRSGSFDEIPLTADDVLAADLRALQSQVQHFFALPAEVKDLSRPLFSECRCGYTTTSSCVEQFTFKWIPPHAAFPWPLALPDFEVVCRRAFSRLFEFAAQGLSGILWSSSGNPETIALLTKDVESAMTESTFFLRRVQRDIEVGSRTVDGVTAHTDSGALTFLFVDKDQGLSGLQVLETSTMQWAEVPPVRPYPRLIVLTGEMMSHIFQLCDVPGAAQCAASVHRVIAGQETPRISMPFQLRLPVWGTSSDLATKMVCLGG